MLSFTRATLLTLALFAPFAASAQQQQPKAPDPELQALIRKTNAYVGLMNRTLRAVTPLDAKSPQLDLQDGDC